MGNNPEGSSNEDEIGEDTGANRIQQAGTGTIHENAQTTLDDLPPRWKKIRDRLVELSQYEGFFLLEGTAHGTKSSSIGKLYSTKSQVELVQDLYTAKLDDHYEDAPSAEDLNKMSLKEIKEMDECIIYLQKHFRCFLGLTEKEIFDMYVEIKNLVRQKRFKLNQHPDKVSLMGYNKMNPHDDVLNVYDEAHLALYIWGCRLHDEDNWLKQRQPSSLSRDQKNKRNRLCSELGLEYTGKQLQRAIWIRNNIIPLFTHPMDRKGVQSGRHTVEWRKHQSISELLDKCSRYFRPPGFAMGWWLDFDHNKGDLTRWFMDLIPKHTKIPWEQWSALYRNMLTHFERGLRRLRKLLLLEYQICADRLELVAILGARPLKDTTVKANRIDPYRDLFLTGMEVRKTDLSKAPEPYHHNGVELTFLLDEYIGDNPLRIEQRFNVLLRARDDIIKYTWMKEHRHGMFLKRMMEQECNKCQLCQCVTCEDHKTLVETAAGMKTVTIFDIIAHHECRPWQDSQPWSCHEFATRYQQRYAEGKSLDICEASNCERCSPVFPNGVDFDHNVEKLNVQADAANYESRERGRSPSGWSKSEHTQKRHLTKITCTTTHAGTTQEQAQARLRDRLGISEADLGDKVGLILSNVKKGINRQLVTEYKNALACHISGNSYCKGGAMDLHHPFELKDVFMEFEGRGRSLEIKKKAMISNLISRPKFVDEVVRELIKVVPAQQDINKFLGYGVKYILSDVIEGMDLCYKAEEKNGIEYDVLQLPEETYKKGLEEFKASKDWHKPLHKRKGTIFYRASEGDEDTDMLGVGLVLDSDELQQDDNASTMMEDDEQIDHVPEAVPPGNAQMVDLAQGTGVGDRLEQFRMDVAIAESEREAEAVQQVDDGMVDLQEDSVRASDSMSVDSMSVDSMAVDSAVSREELLYMTEVKNGEFVVEGKSIREYREMAIEAMIGIVKIENTYKFQRKVDPDLMQQLEDILGQISKVAVYGYEGRKTYKHAAKLWKEFEELFNYYDDEFFTIQGNIIDEEGHCEGYVEPQREWIDVSKIKTGIWTRF